MYSLVIKFNIQIWLRPLFSYLVDLVIGITDLQHNKLSLTSVAYILIPSYWDHNLHEYHNLRVKKNELNGLTNSQEQIKPTQIYIS